MTATAALGAPRLDWWPYLGASLTATYRGPQSFEHLGHDDQWASIHISMRTEKTPTLKRFSKYGNWPYAEMTECTKCTHCHTRTNE
eukprot:2955421-Amphidinium_carterae.1